ncbi:MAG: B12-binding domain-containing radical SAM protein [Velocimicrobium sp.]
MKILLVAINAKYIHSNLAVYSLKKYAGRFGDQIKLCEYTINHYTEDILKGIYKEKPDVVAFSCYIWNAFLVDEVGRELKKVLPQVPIWVGGPEVSYNPLEQLKKKNWLEGVMVGEGEQTFLEVASYYIEKESTLSDIKGIVYREENLIQNTGLRMPLDISSIPFPYDDLEAFHNKIIYYESSRGCPYSCSYCLSSIEKGIRLRKIELVKKELSHFMKHRIPLVKFIDRTFNANHDHAMNIWQYIYEMDEGYTNFHFEISADLLREDEIELVRGFRPGLIQFEIGVQTIHEKTIEAIRRTMDLNKLETAVQKIAMGKNIHQHLDLIAGLPYEGLTSFKKSFDYVYGLRADQLQLGFLKVLKGSYMFEKKEEYQIQYKTTPPFEVLSTAWITYDEILELKKVEEMVEVYYNSGQFVNTILYLEHFYERPYELYEAMGNYYENHQLFEISHTRLNRYLILRDFYMERFGQSLDVFEGILLLDLYLRENLKSRPEFAPDMEEQKEKRHLFYQEESNLRRYLSDYQMYTVKQMRRMTHLEFFKFDIMKTITLGNRVPGETRILFDYKNKNPLSNQARVWEV